jgi:hypothetical protein
MYRKLVDIGPVWTGAENLTPTGFRTPNRPTILDVLFRYSKMFIFVDIGRDEIKILY